jgi:hypothetical protein
MQDYGMQGYGQPAPLLQPNVRKCLFLSIIIIIIIITILILLPCRDTANHLLLQRGVRWSCRKRIRSPNRVSREH